MTNREIKKELEKILERFEGRVFPNDVTRIMSHGIMWDWELEVWSHL